METGEELSVDQFCHIPSPGMILDKHDPPTNPPDPAGPPPAYGNELSQSDIMQPPAQSPPGSSVHAPPPGAPPTQYTQQAWNQPFDPKQHGNPPPPLQQQQQQQQHYQQPVHQSHFGGFPQHGQHLQSKLINTTAAGYLFTFIQSDGSMRKRTSSL